MPEISPSADPQPRLRPVAAWRLAVALVLLAVAAVFTWKTVEGLEARRILRTELAEISHVKYGLLDAGVWVDKLLPILDARIDSLDLTAANQASLKPTIENALYKLLDDVKAKMSAPKPSGGAGGGLGGLMAQGNALMANMMIGALRPHVPEYADVVMAQLSTPETKAAIKGYLKSMLGAGAKTTFGNVDTRYFSYILKKHGCTDAAQCQQKLGDEIHASDTRLASYWGSVLASALVAFLLLLTAAPVLGRAAVVTLLSFCAVLLVGGILTPMIEVEAKVSHFGFTFLGSPITFNDQVLYFQSKSVLEVFHVLITQGRADMLIVGVLVLMFSVIFPALKLCASSLCLWRPSLARTNALARFFALESSKWSMADVMALAIFMTFVAFNGLIAGSMAPLQQTGADLVIPTDSSKLLPGYYLFIGFVVASLFLAKKLEKGIRLAGEKSPAA